MSSNPEMLEVFRQKLALRKYPEYPAERLVIPANEQADDLTLPDGPWSTANNTLPTPEQQEGLIEAGYQLDNLGRPLHPWLRDMLADPAIGVVTGQGHLWNPGGNKTADPIIITKDDEKDKVLLIQRSDNKHWALPGGFVDPGETAVQAAKRELFEEAGLLLIGDDGHKVYEDIIADLRSTAHAWCETTGLLWKVDKPYDVRAGDGTLDAGWFDVDHLPEHTELTHKILIRNALANLALVSTIARGIPAPQEHRTFTTLGGGHMSYEHVLIQTEDDNDVFVKNHADHIFTEPDREADSRLYLQKEKFIYDHLAAHSPMLLPRSVELIDGRSLMMEALKPENGWQWRAPRERTDRYLDEVIDALLLLQTAPLPDDSHISIRPTYETHAIEGWHALSDSKSLDALAAKLQEFRPRMRWQTRNLSDRMVREIPMLMQQFADINDPETFYFAHHDLRQSNVARHPIMGVKVIDWSWAGPGRKNSDITTMLIDLHKYGHDVSRHMQHFDKDHALTLIGFWLNHSMWPDREGDNSVRFQQALSALSAYELLRAR